MFDTVLFTSRSSKKRDDNFIVVSVVVIILSSIYKSFDDDHPSLLENMLKDDRSWRMAFEVDGHI